MTTTTNPGNYVDFDEYVGLKLEKTQSTIRTTDLLTALAGVAAMFLGYLLLFVIFDQWILRDGFGTVSRWILLSILLISTIAWLVWKVGLPSFRTVNGLFAARQIEIAEPGLKSNLLNLIDLKGAGRTVNPAILKAMERRAAVRLQQVDVSNAIDHRPLVRTAYVLLAVIVLFCLYAVFSPKKISNSIWRGLLPAAQVTVATRTEILSFSPGHITVPAHTPSVEVQVDLGGEIPPQVWLVYTSADGKFNQQPVELRADDQGQTRFKGLLIGETAQGLMQDLTYSIRAGDAESAEFKLTVEQPPSAQIETVRIEFPPYMKLPPIEQQNNGQIDAWEGAKVELLAKTNMPVRSGLIQFLDDPLAGPNGEELITNVSQNGQQLQANWTLALRSDGSFAKYYRIDCRTEDGRRDTSPTNHSLTIRPDLPPEVVLLRPERDLEAPVNSTIPLLIQAQDPDFELGYVYLNIEKAGQKILQEQLSEGRQQKLTIKHVLSIAKLHAKKGDVIELWIEVYDNKQPRPNSRNSPKIKISLQDPVTKKQADQQLAEENERIEQQLAEAEREQNSEQTERPDQPDEDNANNARDPNEARANEDATKPRDSTEDEPKQESGEQGRKNERKPEDKQPSSTEKAESGESGEGSKNDRTQTADGNSKKDGSKDPSRQQPLNSDGSQDDEAIKRLVEKFEKNLKDSTEKPDSTGEPEQNEKPSRDSAKKNSPDKRDTPDKTDSTEPNADPRSEDPNELSEDDKDPNSKRDGEGQTDSDKQRTADSKTDKNSEKNKKDKTDDPLTRQEPGSVDETVKDPAQQQKNKTGKEELSPKKEMKKPSGAERSDPRPENKDQGSEDRKDESDQNPQKNNAEGSEDPADPATKPEMTPEQQPGKTDAPPQPSSQSDDGQSGADGQEDPQNQLPEGLNKNSPKQKPSSDQGKQKPGGEGSDSSDPEGTEEPGPESPDAIKKPADGREKGTAKPDRDPNSKPDRANNSNVKRDPKEAPEKRTSQAPASDNPKESQQKPPQGSKKQEPNADGKKTGPPDPSKITDEPRGDSQDSQNPQSKSPNGKNDSNSKPKETDESQPSADDLESSPQSPDSKRSAKPKPEGSDGPGKEGESGAEESAGSKTGEKGNGKPNSSEKKNDAGKETTEDSSSEPESSEEASNQDGDGKSGKGENGDAKKSSDENADAGSEGGEESAENKAGSKKAAEKQDGSKKKPSDAGSKNDQGKESSKEGEKGGAGKKSDKGDKSDKGGAAPGKGDGDKPGKGEAGGKPSTQPGATTPGKPGSNPNGAGGAIGDDGDPAAPTGDGSAVEEGDEANLDYNRQATELVLQKLKKELERGDVDPELLEQLGWNKTEMQQFADRLSQYLNESKQAEESPEVAARQQQFQEMLKSLNLQKSGSQRSGETQPKRDVNQIESRRTPVPPAYRSAYEKFTRDMARQKAAGKK